MPNQSLWLGRLTNLPSNPYCSEKNLIESRNGIATFNSLAISVILSRVFRNKASIRSKLADWLRKRYEVLVLYLMSCNLPWMFVNICIEKRNSKVENNLMHSFQNWFLYWENKYKMLEIILIIFSLFWNWEKMQMFEKIHCFLSIFLLKWIQMLKLI